LLAVAVSKLGFVSGPLVAVAGQRIA
jgi:hypothetical protein